MLTSGVIKSAPNAQTAEELAAWWRVVELCLPSHRQGGAATFQPAGAESVEAEWDIWLAEIFHPFLGPSLRSMQEASTAQSLTALSAADASLGATLPGAVSQASLAAGRTALLDFAPPQGARLLERWQGAARDNASSGHLVSVFAVRGHIFHLPSLQVTGALLLAEFLAGAIAAGAAPSADLTAAMLQRGIGATLSVTAPQVLAV